jgi:hypothetical protein
LLVRLKLYICLLLNGLIFRGRCKKIEPSLKLQVKEDFEGGDVWGTMTDYTNSDETILKRVIKHEAGDYGKGENVFYIIDHRLVFVRSIEIDWDYNEDKTKEQYIITETNYYFNNDRQGIKEIRQTRLFKNDLELGLKELMKLTYRNLTATSDDYVQIKSDLNLDID